jgi:peptide/nickel transport system permease protein
MSTVSNKKDSSSSVAAVQLPPELVHSKVKSESQWQLAWRRLRRHRLAMIGLTVIMVIVTLSVLASVISPYSYEEINLSSSFSPLFSSDSAGGPVHILGTDKLGRDIFSRLLYAGRISLLVALLVTAISIMVGTVLGSMAGSYGGAVDNVLMRFTDIMLTLPDLPILLILSSSLRQFTQLQEFLGSSMSVVIIVFVLSVFGWMGIARLVRGQVLSLRTMPYVEASQALGANRSRVIFSHLIPNSLAPIIVSATLGFGGVIIAESALSFLGFGVMPPVPTWGNMLNEARNAPLEYLFTQALSPGFAIFLTVLSVNFVGDGLRDALDPRLKL